MLTLLAEFLPTTLPIARHSPAFDYLHNWVQSLRPHAALQAIVWGGGAFVAGLLLLVLLGRWITRWNLWLTSFLSLFTLAFYIGFWTLAPQKFDDPSDMISIWLHRIFGASFIVILLRLGDVIVLRPALTRGGRIPLNRFLHQLLLFIAFIYVFVVYLSTAFGYGADRILAGSAIISIVVGLALQDSLGNLFAGVVIQVSNPFVVGDWVVINDDEGRVVDMTWRAVTVLNGSNNHVMIPNSVITKQRIVNLHNPSRISGYSVTIAIDSSVPPEHVIAVLSQSLRDTPGVLIDPAPGASLSEFGESAIKYVAWFSVAHPSEHSGIESRARINIWYHLRVAGISIPYPTRTIEMIDSKADEQVRQKVELAERFNAIGQCELFKSMKEEQRLKLAQESRMLLLAPGQLIYRKGDPGSTLYVIQHGTIDAYVPREHESEEFLATLQAPSFFGEMTAMAGDVRAATTRARVESAVVEIERSHLDMIFQSDKEVMQKVVQVLDERRKASAARLAELAKSHEHPVIEEENEPTLFDRVRGFFHADP